MQLTDDDNGRTVEIATGEELEVILEANPTTGYRWEVSDIDPGVLMAGGSKFLPASGAIGAGGKEALFFRAKEPGRTKLKLLFQRPFEHGKPPVRQFTVTVIVTQR